MADSNLRVLFEMCEHVLADMTSQRKLVLDQTRSSPLAVGSELFSDLESARSF